jgi:hypothetical protein
LELFDSAFSPKVVDAQRQKVIQEIVVGRDVVEHLRYFFFFGLA